MIKLVIDSTANLPQSFVDQYDVTVRPTYVHFGDVTYLDGKDLTTTQFYQKLVEAKETPTTSQISVKDFTEVYQSILDKHAGVEILSLHVSGSLSGIIESARAAAATFPDAKISIFDTQSVAAGHALMTLEAAKMAAAGCTMDEIVARLEKMRKGMALFWTPETLDYLAKSGRIGRAARFLGTMLNLKPILAIKNGAVDAHDRQRSRQRAIASIRDMAEKACKGKSGVHLSIMHAVAEEEAKRLADELRESLKPEVLMISEIGPSVGVYTGPGTLGIGWWVPD